MSRIENAISNQLAIECMEETLLLHCQRAIYRPHTNTLLVSDLHLGKEEVFSRAGLALPKGVSQTNLQRLTELIELYSPKNIMILGDLMHDAAQQDDLWPSELKQWLAAHRGVNVSVVLGNHDRAYLNLDLSINWLKQPYQDPPFLYSHEPISSDSRQESAYVISGHLHPTYVLMTHVDKIRCPVFWFRESSAVLPAFGSFTGGYNIRPDKDDHVYLIGKNEIINLYTETI